MPSKLVTDREKSSRAVAAAAGTHAAAVGEALAKALAQHLKAGETMPNVALLVQLLGRNIQADSAALVKADKAHEAELSDDDAPRRARDEAFEKVRSLLVDLRSGVDSAYGAAGLGVLGLKGETPSDPSAVAGAAAAALEALQDAKRKLPKPRRAGNKLDRAAYVEELTAELPPLQKALAKVANEDREKEATQRAKDQAFATNDRTFTRGAALLASLAAAAGLDDLADKVRPSGRRPGRTAAEDEDAAGDASPEATPS
jgi:hypothetical protein